MTPQESKLRKFRFHRGWIQESMATMVEVKDVQALLDHINTEYMFCVALRVEDLEFAPYGYDARTGWDTYLVSCRQGVLGFSNGIFE